MKTAVNGFFSTGSLLLANAVQIRLGPQVELAVGDRRRGAVVERPAIELVRPDDLKRLARFDRHRTPGCADASR